MSVRTLPVTAACSYEQNSALVTGYQALFEMLKLLPADNFGCKVADFILKPARYLDTRDPRLLTDHCFLLPNPNAILQFRPILHYKLIAPPPKAEYPGGKKDCSRPTTTFLVSSAGTSSLSTPSSASSLSSLNCVIHSLLYLFSFHTTAAPAPSLI